MDLHRLPLPAERRLLQELRVVVNVTSLNIPAGPIQEEPFRAIPYDGDQKAAMHRALREAFTGIEIGAYDRCIADWLTTWEPWVVATICSWMLRARHAGPPVEGDPRPGDVCVTPDGASWWAVRDETEGLLLVDADGLASTVAHVTGAHGPVTVARRSTEAQS